MFKKIRRNNKYVECDGIRIFAFKMIIETKKIDVIHVIPNYLPRKN